MFSWPFRFLSYLAAMASLAAMVLWIVGKAASDRWLLTQFLSWVPSWMCLAATAGCLVLWFVFAVIWRSLIQRPTDVDAEGKPLLPPPRPGNLGARLALVLLIIATAWFLLVDARIQNRFTPRDLGPGVNVLFWNADGARREELVAEVVRPGPDIVVLANAGNPPNLATLQAELRPLAGEASMVQFDIFRVISRYPIKRWAFTSLEIEPAEERFIRAVRTPHDDRGRAMMLEIDPYPTMNKPLILWVLDLPSDPNLSRWSIATQVAEKLAAYRGDETVRHTDGEDEHRPLVGFPLPDVIVGDLNMARGSVAMREITEGMTNAFDQAGYGLVGTYPRDKPFLHIDHVLLSPRLKAARYRVYDGGSGRHRFIMARVMAKPVLGP